MPGTRGFISPLRNLLGFPRRRPGRQGGTLKDTDPYTGETLAEISKADQSDLDEAYQSAAKAQIAWAASSPSERANVMYRSAAIMEARPQEIVNWLIR